MRSGEGGETKKVDRKAWSAPLDNISEKTESFIERHAKARVENKMVENKKFKMLNTYQNTD